MPLWTNTPDRLLTRSVEKTNGCWLWLGGRHKNGYGKVRMEGKDKLPHRVIYEHLRGPIPTGMCIDHLCRNRACVNPSHLEVVSTKENLARGFSPTALNKRRTECIRGHALAGANLYVTPDGRRQCRTCRGFGQAVAV